MLSSLPVEIILLIIDAIKELHHPKHTQAPYAIEYFGDWPERACREADEIR